MDIHHACINDPEAVVTHLNSSTICLLMDSLTPLHLACQHQSWAVQYILNVDFFDPELLTVQDNQGNTPLHTACQYSCNSVDLILQSPYFTTELLYVSNNDMMTPLHIACQYNADAAISIIYFLKQRSLVVNRCWLNPISILHLAARYQPEVINHIATNSILPLDIITYQNQEGNNVLHIAAKYQPDCCQCLIDRYPQLLLMTNLEKQIPAHIAARYTRLDCFDNCKVFHFRDHHQKTPLHIASQYQSSMKHILESQCVEPEYLLWQDDYGETPLHIACQYQPRVVEELINCDKMVPDNLTIQNGDGNIPLHIAIKKNKKVSRTIVASAYFLPSHLNIRNHQQKTVKQLLYQE